MPQKKNTTAREISSKKPKYFDDQFDDEDVLYVFRKHPVVMRRGLILGMVGILLPVLYVGSLTYFRPDDLPSMTFFFGSMGVGFALGALLFFPSWLAWYYSVFIITSQRFIQITQKGLFNRSVSDLGLHHIQTINYEIKGLQETMLGFGTMIIQTYMGDLYIHNVHHPAKTQKKIVSILRQEGIVPDKYPENTEPLESEDEET